MARDVLDTDALESGQLTFVYDTVDLSGEVRAAVDLARSLYEGRRIEVEAPAEPVEIRADADRIHQVFANLIDNAVKNSSPPEPVLVRVVRSDGTAVVTVADKGSGLTEETRARIFDKFVRAHPESVSGTGLGLYITRQIVEAHGGTIDVDSAPGDGATFTVRLPTTTAAAATTG
jgi:two-component system OmpR family sensor kinase